MPSSPPAELSGKQGNAAPNSTGATSTSPAMLTASGNNSGLNRNFGANHSQNEQFEKQVAPVTQNIQSNPVIATDNSEPAMSPLDQKIVRVLRGAFEWGYFLLLLLLLLYLLYKLRQILRRKKNRRHRNQPPEP
jgi:hypothetical protein